MKKTMKIMLLMFLVLTLTLPYSCKNRVNDQDVIGTIGKVKKYRKDQMKDSDIILRSEIMEDTTKLKGTINGLIIYSAYSKTLSESIDKQIEQLEYCGCYENESDLASMKDFSEFISNNEEIMDNTIHMLFDFYNDDVSESSFDIESDLRNFVNYINQLEERSNELDIVIGGMDSYIADNIGVEEKAEKIDNLKSIRDELLFRNIQGAIVMNNIDKINSVYSNQVVYNTEILNQVTLLATDGLNYNIGNEVLGVYSATGELNGILNAIMSNEALGIILFDQGFVGNIETINSGIVLTNFDGLGVLPPWLSNLQILGAVAGLGDQDQLGDNAPAAAEAIGIATLPAAMEQLNAALNSFAAFSGDLNSMEGLSGNVPLP
jgi:hypothetical protein